MPEEATVLQSRQLLKTHELAQQVLAATNSGLAQHCLLHKTGAVVDAAIIAAPSSTKNKNCQRDPELRQTEKGKSFCFGMKAHIGVGAEPELVRMVMGTAANVNDVTQTGALLHGQETTAFGDAGYRGVDMRREARGQTWLVTMQPGKRNAMETTWKSARLLTKAEQLKARGMAKVEHAFRVVKRQFGHATLRYRVLTNNTARLTMLFAPSNRCMARRQVLGAQG